VLWTVDSLGVMNRFGLNLSAEETKSALMYMNPMAAVMTAWRDIFFDHRVPAWQPLATVGLLSLILLWISSGVFERRREEFAELV
jgi:lipopolysaccharide transport system permease protein